MTEFNKLNPYKSKIQERRLLNTSGSAKETYHVSLDISGANLSYAPGDSIGVWPENDPEIIHRILHAAGLTGEEKVFDPRMQKELYLSTFLKKHANLKRITPAFLEKVCGVTFDEPKKRIAFAAERDILDALEAFPPKADSQEAIVHTLAPMLPRFYSIASSQKAHPDELHLLVAAFTYEQNGRIHTGVGSHYLTKADIHEVPIYVHPAKTFHLPPDPTTPIILIGPGTGVAPYKAFLEERAFEKNAGSHWLFFGECNRATDFYYESFFTSYPNLSLSLAFSRDQEEKIYVQHKMLEEKEALYAWINGGAWIYICGDAKRMAKDVTQTIHDIIQTMGGKSDSEARAAVKELRKSGRLHMDVY